MGKRFFDLVIALIGVVLLGPTMISVAALIKLNSRGAVFFRHERVGQFGRLIRILKFRTMVADAESTGPSITTSKDERITTIGRFLRKYKIDETPQLFNVIMGDMSLVGPRPEVPEFVNLYPVEKMKKILSVRPGITDNASIEFRNENELLSEADDPIKCYVNKILPLKIALYEKYVDEHSIRGDLSIIFRTVFAVLVKN